MKIQGKVALVTGGASGIGKALARKLLEEGIKLVTVIDLNGGDGQTTVDEFSHQFGADRVKFVQCDVTHEDQLRRSFEETYNAHKTLDVVVHSAGIFSKDHIQTINVNLIAVMNGMTIANKVMTRQKRTEKGVIVNMGSLTGFAAYEDVPIGYTVSKHGVIGLTKAFRSSSDGFSKDLRAVALCPGIIDTGILVRSGYMTKEDARVKIAGAERIDDAVSMSSVVDAFMQALEDDSMNGALIKVEASGTTVVPGP